MALKNFIETLSKDVKYSEPSTSSVRVIPPEKQSLQVWPPETNTITEESKAEPATIEKSDVEKPTASAKEVSVTPPAKPTIKLNIKLKQADRSNAQPVSSFTKPEEKTDSLTKSEVSAKSSVIETKKEEVSDTKVEEKSKEKSKPLEVEKPKELTADELFDLTGTETSKKEIWLDYYNRAKNSRKKNVIVDRMKIGRFTLTPDNKPLLLPDYDIVGKDPDDVLKDKWF